MSHHALSPHPRQSSSSLLSSPVVGLVVAALVTTSAARPTDAGESNGKTNEKPNIVFILADDMGYGDPGCYNPESKAPTPYIDRLAREGMRFTDAHAPAAVCVPSRYGLLTGRYPFRETLDWRHRAVISPDRPTIASLLKKNGYATAMVGKWHQGFDNGPNHDGSRLTGGPVDRGFDSYFGIPASLDIPPYYYIRDRKPLAPPTERVGDSNTRGWTRIQGAFWRAGGVAPGFKHEEVLPRFGKEAVATIDRLARATSERPFFLYVAFTAPHTPWLPLERFRGKSGADMYGDFVAQVDDTVGQILGALDRNGLKGSTLVFFSSDNGPVWYPDDVERFGHRSTGPLRGMKGDAWEGGHRVPFIARWPGKISPGSTSDRTICFVDLMATFAAIAGETLPGDAGLDSVDFLPVLLGKAKGPVREVTVLKQNASVLREGKWKLITHLGSGGFSKPRRPRAKPGEPAGQLYDLEKDPGETDNLWAKRPRIVERLQERLTALTEGARPGARRGARRKSPRSGPSPELPEGAKKRRSR